MLRLPPLAALLLLLLSSVGPTVGEVATSITSCHQFFLRTVPPEIPGVLVGGNILNQNRYKPICQTLLNTHRFVTLYDTTNKIPVFSAYNYTKITGISRPSTIWKIEPQLEKQPANMNMIKDAGGSYTHQAGSKDYKNTVGIDRGHLLPSCYGGSLDVKKATFTLTNIVPQDGTFNKGTWCKMEQCVKCVMDTQCMPEGYLVIGAEPGNNNLNGVNIPSRLWSAFCCNTAKGWIASAFWGTNDAIQPTVLPTQTLAQLTNQVGPQPFPGSACPTTTTVAHLYPNLPAACNCK